MSHKENYKNLFLDLSKSKGYKIINPFNNQKKLNIDYILEGQINGQSTKVSVDIKKKNGKNGNHWVYIEYENSKGGEGWLYGASDFIVFETVNDFIFVPRKKLISYLNSMDLVRFDLPYVDKPWNSKYRLFRRKGTLETITQIKVKDLLLVQGCQVWKKHDKKTK